MALPEVSLDIVLRRLQKVLKLVLIHTIEEYLNLCNKTKTCRRANYIGN